MGGLFFIGASGLADELFELFLGEDLDVLAWAWLADGVNSPYNHSAGAAGTLTYRAQWFDRLMNLGPLSDPVSCAVTS